jgi:sodium transport system ATP-binding protein
MINVVELSKNFNKTLALKEINFGAADGEITTLLGGNGSGKTTCMRIIAGAYAPRSGRVEIDGIDVRTRKTAALARLGVLHDDFGLYPRLTVVEHLRFAARLHGLSGRALSTAIDGALDALSLNELRNRTTAGMSHGESMKVALARALVPRPHNIMLDEPTRGLDIFAVRLLRDLLKRLRAEGVCVLMSNHAMPEVMELSDRVIVVEQGRVLANDTPHKLIQSTGAVDLEGAFMALVNAERQKVLS